LVDRRDDKAIIKSHTYKVEVPGFKPRSWRSA